MTDRFYCPNCETPIPERRVKLARLLPVTRAPWPLFEYLEKPVCPVCDGDLLDTLWTPPDVLVAMDDKQQEGSET